MSYGDLYFFQQLNLQKKNCFSQFIKKRKMIAGDLDFFGQNIYLWVQARIEGPEADW